MPCGIATLRKEKSGLASNYALLTATTNYDSPTTGLGFQTTKQRACWNCFIGPPRLAVPDLVSDWP